MGNIVSSYLTRFKASLRIDSNVRESIAEEVYAHLKDKSQELKEKGFSEEEADKLAVQALGSPELIAQQIYETHAQGSWQEALLAALPHFMVALLFASYYWQNTFCISLLMIAIVGVAIYGWHQNKPVWFFPWLGYYLLPIVVSGILLVHLSSGWGWIATFTYVLMVLVIIIYIVEQTVRRDEVYALLMLSPLPVMFGWLLALGMLGGLMRSDVAMARLQINVPWITVTFLVLAMATVVSFRLKQRQHKIAVLSILPVTILLSVALVSVLT